MLNMADDDEVDVLGDFSLDNLLSKNLTEISSCYDNSILSSHNVELLNCDYSLQSSWLLENPTTNSDCWYTNSDSVFNPEDGNSETNTSLGFDEVICTENKTTDESGWTEDEKISLHKGLEIFGKNSVNLSQFIGSKTSAEVKYYVKHYTHNAVNNFNNIYNAVEINDKNLAKHSSLTYNIELPSIFKVSDIVEDSEIPASIEEVIAAVSTGKPTIQNIYKGATTNKKICNINNFKRGQTIFKKKANKSLRPQKSMNRKRFRTHEYGQLQIANSDENKKENSLHKVLPVSSGEELIKIKKEDVELEADIDIDIDTEDTFKEKTDTEAVSIQFKEKESTDVNINSEKNGIKETSEAYNSSEVILNKNEHKENLKNALFNERLKSLDESVIKVLTSTEIPTKEFVLEEHVISDVEKFIHSEFFEGRPTKTPSRYLKIRNYIISHWYNKKPTYCTKVSVRQGLRNCGDVNCIGRIHQYLEQIGAINFKCVQVNYIRPLLKLINSSITKEKINLPPQKVEIMRPRMKKKYNHDGEGGYTMMHDENGEVIDTTVVNQDKQNKPKTSKRQNVKLVYCKSFTDEKKPPYEVMLHISALLLMDLHAHSALIEVIGLLGGKFDRNSGSLFITRYVPCRGVDHSDTHCDMCPVSQCEAFEVLHEENLEVVGWFHSHPTFYPNPSLQDIDTQLNMQQYLSTESKPFVGIILSPFRDLANTLASEYRCLIVNKNESTKDGVGVPYKFQINHISVDLNVGRFLMQVRDMLKMENNIPEESIVNFQKPYYYDTSISYLDKVLSSIKLHLARCGEINKMTCDAITEGITCACSNTMDR